MMNKIKNIADFMSIVWVFGGGFVIALLCLIWMWEIALAIFCVWLLSCIVTVALAIRG